MNNNAAAIFKSLIVYAVCVPLAVFVGYTLTNPLDYSTLGFYGIVIMLLLTPLLLRWHYPLLLLSWNLSVVVFFAPSKPPLWLPMVVISLGISVLERVMSNDRHFIRVPQVTWPLLALAAVVYFTAELTGGLGVKALGSDVYGGKKYIYIFVGILSYFALSARPIPLEKARKYVALFFLGGLVMFIGDFAAIMPSALHFIYLVIPPGGFGLDEYGNQTLEFGETRMGGVAFSACSVVFWMLARYGLRGIFMSGKLWRPLVFMLSFGLIFLGGFRSTILLMALIFVFQFFKEGLHRSRLLIPFLFVGVTAVALLIPLARHLPWTVQRSLAFLPLDIDPTARGDAEGSSDWRLNIWKALLPQVPEHLLLGKGYAISTETFNEVMGGSTLDSSSFDAANNPLALAGDYHSGPFSVVLVFGIWGTIAWLWFWWGSLRVLSANVKYGNPALRSINLLLYVAYIAKCIIFVFVFGAIQGDLGQFAGLVGLSVALNNGMCRPAPKTVQVSPPVVAAKTFPMPRPAFQR
jgi:hypothetical protein